MDALLRDVSAAVELLAVARRGGAVKQWGEPELSRAFRWGHYCERVFSRFHNNPAIRRIVEQQLQITNHSLQVAFPGFPEISFSDLSRCQHLLLVGLLSNPELPSSIMKMLFDPPVNPQRPHHDGVTGMCSRIVQCKSACKVLGVLDGSAAGADAEVQGGMLMERLDALLSQRNDASITEHFLGSVLEGCEGEARQFCRIIAAALLTAKNSDAQTASQDFLLEWLQKNTRVLQLMCSALPAVLLKDLAKEHVKFRESYCDVLKRWASDMEYSLSDGEWVQTGTNRTVTFQRLTEHFQALFDGCPSLKEDVGKELQALKMSDGNFDVKCLSVWGDLLSALNK
ncbi:Fanconi anemia group F protein [Antennarius striatus]|uniref:Fanconi anemia group F protein n=1 Tax=Antennarius striatus TaxID=241820 RepID=UPI0035B1F0C0